MIDMDYEDSFTEFKVFLDLFCYNIELQLECICKKIDQYSVYYDRESTDQGRATCLKYVAKLNDLYIEYLLDYARMTLGVSFRDSQQVFKKRRDTLLERYKGGKDKDTIKMHNDIEKAYDILQCFKA